MMLSAEACIEMTSADVNVADKQRGNVNTSRTSCFIRLTLLEFQRSIQFRPTPAARAALHDAPRLRSEKAQPVAPSRLLPKRFATAKVSIRLNFWEHLPNEIGQSGMVAVRLYYVNYKRSKSLIIKVFRCKCATAGDGRGGAACLKCAGEVATLQLFVMSL